MISDCQRLQLFLLLHLVMSARHITSELFCCLHGFRLTVLVKQTFVQMRHKDESVFSSPPLPKRRHLDAYLAQQYKRKSFIKHSYFHKFKML